MENKNNVWIVKLNPNGGLLTTKDYNKWIEHTPELKQALDESFDKNQKKIYKDKYKKGEIAKKCKGENIIAIGWILNPQDSWLNNNHTAISKDAYRDLYKYTPWSAENKGELNPSIQEFQELEIGDFVWVRDSSDIYYICKITGDWYYDNSKEAWAMDIAQRYNCIWVEVGDATEVPAKIVKKLITIGHTVSKVDDENLLKMSKYLFENDGKDAVKKAVKEFDDNNYSTGNIIDNLTEYVYEN